MVAVVCDRDQGCTGPIGGGDCDQVCGLIGGCSTLCGGANPM